MSDVGNGSILSNMDVQSVYVSMQHSLSSSQEISAAYLSGLKSLVTMVPGAITRCSLGNSVFAKVFCSVTNVSIHHDHASTKLEQPAR